MNTSGKRTGMFQRNINLTSRKISGNPTLLECQSLPNGGDFSETLVADS